ncbi:phage integrase family protein [Tahibacter aquaticus]|uniref:Phage integrase family protein n=1 Tax=Tahibacter aquaticus TaxID=520092 RepID=A0A4R6YPC0_9GAMM|nr:VPA1269 family protein [Tahibacter aquaticus]TDR39638.1 phage integrase family protein [Tahibacter aquaticus]
MSKRRTRTTNRQKLHRPGNYDPEFKWATEHEPGLERWRSVLAEWVKECTHQAPAMRAGRELVRYLWAFPSTTRDPRRFCNPDYGAPTELGAFLDRSGGRSNDETKIHNGIYRFFHWLLHERRAGPLAADKGHHRNPLSHRPLVPGAARTHRTPMPMALLDALADLLTADDFAWPKTLEADWVHDVRGERVWCPVRAVALLVKLRLPLRNADVVFLESSEGDIERFTPEGWVRNPAPCCTGRRGAAPQRGFLHRLRGIDGVDRTVFFVNTDKGYDRKRFDHHPGRVLPWPQAQVAAAVYALEAWQVEHNPVAAPTRWTALQALRVRRDRQAYARQPDAFFLFRDPRVVPRNEPLDTLQLQGMWLAALDEMERRIKAGRYPELAAVIPRLIDRRSTTGLPRHAVYDLHTPRVSYATALHDAGVPLTTIGRCLGHATERMTSHYYAPSDATVAAHLEQAQEHLRERRAADLHACEVPGAAAPWIPARWAAGAFGTGEGPAGLAGPVFSTTGFGVCPVGAGRCHVGGPPTRDGVHGPAPGGLHRCLQCRFFVSSPAHLPALLDRLNVLSTTYGRRIASYWRREGEAREFEDRLGQAGDADVRTVLRAHLAKAEGAAGDALKEVEEFQPVWEAAFAAAQRCRAAAHAAMGGLDLVANGSADDWSEALAAAHEPAVLRALAEGARMHFGPNAEAAEMARVLSDRLIAEHRIAPHPATMSAVESAVVAEAQVEWRARVERGAVESGVKARRSLWAWAEAGCRG